ncbi:hypothetical protein ACH95_06000 [Bacillus glycinifermentans]|uniref:Uncharacterized protein n=1 Tax=Bacillus glycinifermentans TaxID=1664069 RepID=A0A0J6HBG7_9BACI|nr:hypothetical protein ACH95_06000 [Bacillus glycinifermentans]KRT93932.1 hypothetical protein AB447_216415 [Bacillus glycinifermentans]
MSLIQQFRCQNNGLMGKTFGYQGFKGLLYSGKLTVCRFDFIAKEANLCVRLLPADQLNNTADGLTAVLDVF